MDKKEGRQLRHVNAQLKHIEAAQKALDCVDIECALDSETGERECANELIIKWDTIRCYLEEWREEFELKKYFLENPITD